MNSTFRRTRDFHLQDIICRLMEGDRISLSKAITLVESKLPKDKKAASELLDHILPHTGKSFRLGITGVPGVGKSTFIEAFGKFLTSNGKMVAVLSIDPSSSRTRGSILGDKTRMTLLSADPNAYIRPTASGNSLGGVSSTTRESILLCEAAGYDFIIVETVGVGQGETLVKDMTDYFLLMMLAGGGDELQGIKRGIMEMADHILINKAEESNKKEAQCALKDYRNAIHLFPPHEAGWTVPVGLCSALQKRGMEAVFPSIEKYQALMMDNGWLLKNRQKQNLQWFHERIKSRLEEEFYADEVIRQQIDKSTSLILNGKLSTRKAVDELFDRPASQ